MAEQKKLIWHEFPWILAGEALLLGLLVLGELMPLGLLALPRAILGLAYVLFLPGYALQAALFPRRTEMDGLERVGLSFGLSVAVVALLALVLNALPWGIRLWTIAAAEGLLLVGSVLAAVWRRGRLAEEDRYLPRIHLDLRGLWGSQDRTGRILLGVLSAALLVMLGVAISFAILPSPAEFFTEFYILGEEGLAESYPRMVTAGEPVVVTVGITNHERDGHLYRVEAWAQDGYDASTRQLAVQAGPFDLKVGQALEFDLEWRMPAAGDDQQVLFFLYLDDAAEPYRSLRLWVNVEAVP